MVYERSFLHGFSTPHPTLFIAETAAVSFRNAKNTFTFKQQNTLKHYALFYVNYICKTKYILYFHKINVHLQAQRQRNKKGKDESV